MTPLELKVLRKTLGISQQDAAKTLGIDRITYWRYENEAATDGSSRIKVHQVLSLKRAAKRLYCPKCGVNVFSET